MGGRIDKCTNTHACARAHKYTHTYTQMHTDTHRRAHTLRHTGTHACAHSQPHLNMHSNNTHTYTDWRPCKCVCACACHLMCSAAQNVCKRDERARSTSCAQLHKMCAKGMNVHASCIASHVLMLHAN